MSPLIPALIGGVVSAFGQYRANKETKNYLTRMSNTGYQRAMSDMKAAGLNPMLASKLGPASTPNYQAGNVGASAVSGFNLSSSAMQNIAQAEYVSGIQTTKAVEEMDTIINDRRIKDVLHDERWPRQMAIMSRENVLTALIAAKYNLPIEQILKDAKLSEAEQARVGQAIREINAQDSFVTRESAGVVETAKRGWDASAKGYNQAVKELEKSTDALLKKLERMNSRGSKARTLNDFNYFWSN